jgi:hypothetical protein
VFRPNSFITTNIYEAISRRIPASGLVRKHIRDDIDIDQTRSCLQSAWGTEALILMSGEVFREEEAVRLSNNWSAIQTYYVLYHCAQALHVAQGHPRPDSHPKTQNAFFNQWASRPGLLEPWTFGYGASGPVNCPPQVHIDVSVHAWSTCEGGNAWNLYAKALMTTRRDDIAERQRATRKRKKQALRRAWNEEEQRRISLGRRPRRQPVFPLPQLTPAEKAHVDTATRSHSLIDYLYRLRLKTNYEDSNMFTDGPEDQYQSSGVRSAFNSIASGSLFLYECAIGAIIGRQRLVEWADAWAEKNLPARSDLGVAGRRAHH